MNRARKPWIVGVAVALVIGIAAAVAVGRSHLQRDKDKAAVTLEFEAREVVQPAVGHDAGGHRVFRPAGGAADGGGAGQGRRHAGGAWRCTRAVAGQGGPVARAHRPGRAGEPQQRAPGQRSTAARAALAQAERTHASNERLAAQQFISPIALETSRSQVDSARAQYEAAMAMLDVTRVGLREAALVAPIGGIVAKRHVVPGEKVAIEQTVLTIVDLARLELAGMVGTHEVPRLQPGMAVQVQRRRHAGAGGGRGWRASRRPPRPGTRSIGVTIALDNPKETLRAGQYALARVDLADDTKRLTRAADGASATPRARIRCGSSSDGALAAPRGDARPARRGATGASRCCSGVNARRQVLAARFDNLREGAKAVVVGSKTPAPRRGVGRARRRCAERKSLRSCAMWITRVVDQQPGLRHHGDGGAVRAGPVLVRPLERRADARRQRRRAR